MTRIDDPLDQTELQTTFAEQTDPSNAISITLNVAAPIVALLTANPAVGALAALSAFAAQFSADHRRQARAAAFQEGLRDGAHNASDQLAAIEKKIAGPDAEEAVTVAIRAALQSTRLDKARLVGRILGATLSQNDPKWNEAAEFIRTIEQFTDDDVRALRVIWNVQKTAWRSVQAGADRREMSTNANDYTEHWKEVLAQVEKAGTSKDDWYSRCARLNGFGLALQVQPNMAYQGPDAVCYRLTGRAARLMQLLGVFVDPREYPKMLYHRNGQQRIVQNPEEEHGLGPEWAKSPAAFV